MAYIYKITNLINQRSYIGKTENTIKQRFRMHCQDACKAQNQHRPLYRAMRKYGLKNFVIEEIEQTDEPNEREQYWIAYYGTYKNGYNATPGGDGRSYIDREAVVQAYKEVKCVKEVAKMLHIDYCTASTILKNCHVQIKSSADMSIERCSLPVDMLDLDGNIVKEFRSVTDAGRYMENNDLCGSLPHRHISDVCRGKRKTAYGYRWRYHAT